MKILALEPYFGGSHRAFLDNWSVLSRHQWTVLGLKPSKWKWRMRHGAISLADQVLKRVSGGETYDLLICSDMLNLAEFQGLIGSPVNRLPAITYFHENQLTYPVRVEAERDLHFGMINFTSCLAADQVWFNSAFHRDSFLSGLDRFLRRMPDYNSLEKIEVIRAGSDILPQGIAEIPARTSRQPGPPRILWAARWEFDKTPELFFAAVEKLKNSGVDFRMSVIGEQFERMPDIFARAKNGLEDRIDHWGFQSSREAYLQALGEADIIVSTADHEFFGVGVVEAVAAGAFPLLPRRLAYPEIFDQGDKTSVNDFFYDGSLDHLVKRLSELTLSVENQTLWNGDAGHGRRIVEPYFWKNLVPRLDAGLDAVAERAAG